MVDFRFLAKQPALIYGDMRLVTDRRQCILRKKIKIFITKVITGHWNQMIQIIVRDRVFTHRWWRSKHFQMNSQTEMNTMSTSLVVSRSTILQVKKRSKTEQMKMNQVSSIWETSGGLILYLNSGKILRSTA